jgi:hypothetical protein
VQPDRRRIARRGALDAQHGRERDVVFPRRVRRGLLEHAHVILGERKLCDACRGLRMRRRASIPSHRWSLRGLSRFSRGEQGPDAPFVAHNGMESMRNNPGVAHKNGSLESVHGPF